MPLFPNMNKPSLGGVAGQEDTPTQGARSASASTRPRRESFSFSQDDNETRNGNGKAGAVKRKAKRHQVKQACIACRKACKKCAEMRPCVRCQKFGLDCIDVERRRRERGTVKKPVTKGRSKRKARESSPSTPSSISYSEEDEDDGYSSADARSVLSEPLELPPPAIDFQPMLSTTHQQQPLDQLLPPLPQQQFTSPFPAPFLKSLYDSLQQPSFQLPSSSLQQIAESTNLLEDCDCDSCASCDDPTCSCSAFVTLANGPTEMVEVVDQHEHELYWVVQGDTSGREGSTGGKVDPRTLERLMFGGSG